MPSRMLPSKLVWERYRLAFDFNTVLELNEFVVDWDVYNQALTGDDSDPDEMITTQKQLTDNVVYQWVRFGLPGVVYGFRCVAVTNLGRTVELVKKLAVLLAPAIVPPLFGTYYSTTPYPVEVVEALNVSGFPRNIYLVTPDLGEVDLSVILLDGNLREPLVTYIMQIESMDLSMTVLSGTLVAPLVTYSNWPFEAIDLTCSPLNGSLVVILVTYSNWPFEALDLGAEITGGSLV